MTPSPASPTTIASVLPEYEILGELGRGAMGVVLLARHRTLGRHVAIKELPRQLAADDGVRTRFVHEARTLAHLNHPHVVGIYDFIDRNGHLALVMEQLGGGTVWDQHVRGSLTAPLACGLMLAAAAGLDHAHNHGVLHRDVKPDNLMFTSTGQLKVTDFGIAKVVAGDKTVATADGTVVGTPAYMAPEQAEGDAVGPAADVYACGTILFELLTGRLPFPNAQTPMALLLARVKQEAPSILAFAPQVSGPIAEVTSRALSRSVEYRYQTIKEFGIALGHAAAETWGLEWLNGIGVPVTGSAQIEQAARTTQDVHLIDTAIQPAYPSGPSTDGDHFQRDYYQPYQEFQAVGYAAAPADYGYGHTTNSLPQTTRDLSTVNAEELVDIRELQRDSSLGRLWGASVLATAASITVAFAAPALFTNDSPEIVVTAPDNSLLPMIAVDGQRHTPQNRLTIDPDHSIVLDGLEGSRVRLNAFSVDSVIDRREATIDNGQVVLQLGDLPWAADETMSVDLSVDDETQPFASMSMSPTRAGRSPLWLLAAVGLVALGLLGLTSAWDQLKSRATATVGVGIASASGAIVGTSLWLLATHLTGSGAVLGAGVAATGFGGLAAGLGAAAYARQLSQDRIHQGWDQ